jgi:hypothetical protein
MPNADVLETIKEKKIDRRVIPASRFMAARHIVWRETQDISG